MGAQENKFQISQELRKEGKIVMHKISLIFVKFKAFEVCLLSQAPIGTVLWSYFIQLYTNLCSSGKNNISRVSEANE